MASFPPLDESIARYARNGDAELSREHRGHLAFLARHDGSHDYPYCWGYTIYRTAYGPGSDESFRRAVDRLGVYAKAWTDSDPDFPRGGRIRWKDPKDPRPNEELWSRYYSEVVQDPETLADATVEEVGRRFDAWVTEHVRQPNTEGRQRTPNARYMACVILDQQGIDNILSMPEDPDVSIKEDPEQYDRWVRMMTVFDWPEGTGRFWFRAGIKDAMWGLWFAVEDEDFFWEEQCWDDPEGNWNMRSYLGPNSIWNRQL